VQNALPLSTMPGACSLLLQFPGSCELCVPHLTAVSSILFLSQYALNTYAAARQQGSKYVM
jgi:hypothetical protein